MAFSFAFATAILRFVRKFEAFQSSRIARSERGAVAFIVTVLVGFLIVFILGALALDLSRTADRGQDLQNSADAAALAAVVVYEDEQVKGTPIDDAEDLAEDKAKEVLLQNGIDIDGDPNLSVEFDYPGGSGRVNVRVIDRTVTSILGPLSQSALGFDQEISRQATADFISCATCALNVKIPGPFSAASVGGNGDGFIPIEVGNRLYALNHNNSGNQIVCIDTQTGRPCWRVGDSPTGPREPGRPAYPSGVFSGNSPEMPHAGVVGDLIYWSATAPSGLHLYCWDTSNDLPCISGRRMGTDPRGVEPTQPFFNEGGGTLLKDEARGGGTIAYNDRIYLFSDNHEIHCYNPASNGPCTDFTGIFDSLDTGLAIFPDNDVAVGNHGGSIDRIVDDVSGFIYSTIHIPVADETVADCSVTTPATSVDDMVDRVVTIETGGEYLSAPAIDIVSTSFDPTNQIAQWRVTRDETNPTDLSFFLEAVGIEEPTTKWYLDDDGNTGMFPGVLDTDAVRVEDDNQWNFTQSGSGFEIEHEVSVTTGALVPGFLNLPAPGSPVIDVAPATVWNVSICSDPALDAGYTSGTWIHCFDTGVVSNLTPAPCASFVQTTPLHPDASRLSGRLFFHYEPTPPDVPANKAALCSTGFVSPYTRGIATDVEVNCVNLETGAPESFDYSVFETDLTNATGDTPDAWGVPHYNSFQNRMFYPSQHSANRVLCWDFNAVPAASCGVAVGMSQPVPGIPAQNGVPEDPPIPAGRTEDYGYISKDNCVFGLGHTAKFWAFAADDVGQPCVGATTFTDLSQCLCTGGAPRWGVLDFSAINLADFARLDFQITTVPPPGREFGDLLWPPLAQPGDTRRNTWWSFTPGGQSTVVDLDPILQPDPANPPPFTTVRLVFYAEADKDAFDQAVGELRFLQTPKLVE